MTRRLKTSSRRSDAEVSSEDTGDFLWAISYSDLLMVLMSFFVIYFSVNDEKRGTVLQNIAISMKKRTVGAAVNTGSNSVASKTGALGENLNSSEVPAPHSPMLSTNIVAHIKLNLPKGLKISHEADDVTGLVVDFPDDLFESGQFRLGHSIHNELEEVFSVLKPYAKEVHLVFVGHTDEKPISHLNRKFVQSNLALSNLRASHAADWAVSSGFDPKFVSTEGFAEYARGSRSLSLKIKTRGKP